MCIKMYSRRLVVAPGRGRPLSTICTSHARLIQGPCYLQHPRRLLHHSRRLYASPTGHDNPALVENHGSAYTRFMQDMKSTAGRYQCVWKGNYEHSNLEAEVSIKAHDCQVEIYPTWFEHSEIYLLRSEQDETQSSEGNHQSQTHHYWDRDLAMKKSEEDGRLDIDIKGSQSSSSSQSSTSKLVVCMPQFAPVNIFHSGAGDIRLLDKIENDVHVRTDYGNIYCNKIRGVNVTLMSQYGNLTATSAIEGNVDIYGRGISFQKLLTGNLTMVADERISGAGLYAQRAVVTTQDGDISLGTSHGDLRLETQNGNIDLPDARGCINAIVHKAGSVSLHLEYPEGHSLLQAGQSTGDVDCHLSAAENLLAELEGSTVNIPENIRDQLKPVSKASGMCYQGRITLSGNPVEDPSSRKKIGKIDQNVAANIPGNFLHESVDPSTDSAALRCSATSGTVSLHAKSWKDVVMERYYSRARNEHA